MSIEVGPFITGFPIDPFVDGWRKDDRERLSLRLSEKGREKIIEKWEIFKNKHLYVTDFDFNEIRKDKDRYIDELKAQEGWSDNFTKKITSSFNSRISAEEKKKFVYDMENNENGTTARLWKEAAERLGKSKSLMAGEIIRFKNENQLNEVGLGLTAAAILYFLEKHKDLSPEELSNAGIKSLKRLDQKAKTEPIPVTARIPPEQPQKKYTGAIIYEAPTIHSPAAEVKEESQKDKWKEILLAGAALAGAIGAGQAVKRFFRHEHKEQPKKRTYKKEGAGIIGAAVLSCIACSLCWIAAQTELESIKHVPAPTIPATATQTEALTPFVFPTIKIPTATPLPTETTVPTEIPTSLPTETESIEPSVTPTSLPYKGVIPKNGGMEPSVRNLETTAALLTATSLAEIIRRRIKKKIN